MSDFPTPENYTTPQSNIHRKRLEKLGVSNSFPLVIKREKGVYVIDIDGYKYVDFSLHQGRTPLGHQPGVLSHRVKNGMSVAMGNAYINRFTFALVKELQKHQDFEQIFLYQSETSMMHSLTHPLINQKVGVTSQWLKEDLEKYLPHAPILKAKKGDTFDILFMEALNFDDDLSELNPEDYHSEIKIGVLTRTYGRWPGLGGLNLTQVHAIAVGASAANGIPSGFIVSGKDFRVSQETPSLPVTLAMLEIARLYDREHLRETPWPQQKGYYLRTQSGPYIKLTKTLECQQLLKHGILAAGDLFTLSPQHTEQDLRRLHRVLAALIGT